MSRRARTLVVADVEVEVCDASINTPAGRPLFEALHLRLSNEKVALIGRNGVGKSTLLAVLAGIADVDRGRVKTRTKPHFVPQILVSSLSPSLSHGELRRRALIEAESSRASILLLDEPTEDLDEGAVSWLRAWLKEWRYGCVVVASHDRRLLADFQHFFIVSETGCRYVNGTLAEVEDALEREHDESQQRYVRNLNRLVAHEAHTVHIERRKARKKRYGRCAEIDRATPKARLNQKRDHAQVSHGRLKKVREERLESIRQRSKLTRRSLGATLSLELSIPKLPFADNDNAADGDIIVASNVSSYDAKDRCLFESLELRLRRQRVAIIGPNGAGKTTLVQILLGRRKPTSGSIFRDLSKIGSIEQGGADWMLDESLLTRLRTQMQSGVRRRRGEEGDDDNDNEHLAAEELLVTHKFPLALAERPLSSLSPGERARAALICLFQCAPPIELLILDEPTFSLDLVGQRAMTRALRAWPGGLVVVSHDRELISNINAEIVIELRGETS